MISWNGDFHFDLMTGAVVRLRTDLVTGMIGGCVDCGLIIVAGLAAVSDDAEALSKG
jgi:hypothetical protein